MDYAESSFISSHCGVYILLGTVCRCIYNEKGNSVKTEFSLRNESLFSEILCFTLSKSKQNTSVSVRSFISNVSGVGLMHPSHVKAVDVAFRQGWSVWKQTLQLRNSDCVWATCKLSFLRTEENLKGRNVALLLLESLLCLPLKSCDFAVGLKTTGGY